MTLRPLQSQQSHFGRNSRMEEERKGEGALKWPYKRNGALPFDKTRHWRFTPKSEDHKNTRLVYQFHGHWKFKLVTDRPLHYGLERHL